MIAFVCRFIITRVLRADGTLLYENHPYSPLNAFLIACLSIPKPLIAEGWFAGLSEAKQQNSTIADIKTLEELKPPKIC